MRKMFAIALFCVVLTSCVQETTEKFTVLLDWAPNTNHIGLFVAQEKGFYREIGLDVYIKGSDASNNLEMLVMGNGDVAVGYQEALTAARVGSPPLEVKAIATILQKNTSGFASKKSLKSAKDLEGMSYGSWGTDIETAFLKSVMSKNDADFSKIDVKVINALDTLTMLNEAADFAWIYYGWDGIMAEKQGISLDYLPLEQLDSNINFYSPLLAATDSTLEKKKDQIDKFLEATQKGYEYATNNLDEATSILCEVDSTLDPTFIRASLEYLKDYFLDGDGKWGSMDEQVWRNFTAWLYENEVISQIPDYRTLYTQ